MHITKECACTSVQVATIHPGNFMVSVAYTLYISVAYIVLEPCFTVILLQCYQNEQGLCNFSDFDGDNTKTIEITEMKMVVNHKTIELKMKMVVNYKL